uniref:Uncharacterized protein n=1 Tax=Marseillevirus LCMAC102 TaxID=2506603 RepID=A0A481YTF5_9VIRU|nr:MAG: uncharacterized protein LCMAC102_00850 [Marseillevirus LCMAC102]
MTEKKTPEWLVPNYPSLKGDDAVGQAAVNGQIVAYPNVVRTMVDSPISGQKISGMSFMLFKEPRKFSNGKYFYGFVKNRGNWADENQAKFEASKIIREVDSKYQIRLAPTGAWVPITDEDAFTKEFLDVRMKDDEIHLRDQGVKEKESEQRRMAREIREREDELRDEGDIYDDKKSLKYYSMRRVTELRLGETIEYKLREVESLRKTLRKVQKELKRIEGDCGDYKNEWLNCYNVERRKTGIPDYVPSEEQIREYEDVCFETLDDSDEEDQKEKGIK